MTNVGAVAALHWAGDRLQALDQRLLPVRAEWRDLMRWEDVAGAIRTLQVRGAPAIGLAGAYGLLLAAQDAAALPIAAFRERVRAAAAELSAARPTAVNLSWAIERVLRAAEAAPDAAHGVAVMLAEAEAIAAEDLRANLAIGEHGAALLPEGARALTHCNTGALATTGHGTALGIVRTAWAQGKLAGVVATETRPLLQGARLTAWELAQEGIPATLIVDSAAGVALRDGGIDAVIVGADRIAANGDVANKIGTYTLAVLAQAHGVPFYVAAPTSTLDLSLDSGEDIVIEERGADEVAAPWGIRLAPEGVAVANPAFDVTPAAFITAIVTERGVHRPPYSDSLRAGARDA